MNIIAFVIVCIGWVFSVCIHEFAHALVAYYGGDRSVAEKGYLTMNPLKYTHPLFSLALPMLFLIFGGIGLPGGAVYINDDMLRSKRWRTAVSLAGPAASAVLMVLLALPFLLGVFPPGDQSARACILAFLVALQAVAVLLNLLPIPPLDGFRALTPWMRSELRDQLMRNSQFLFIGFLIAMRLIPVISHTLWATADAIIAPLGVTRRQVWLGQQAFMFWRTM